jgi:hypothetical protein
MVKTGSAIMRRRKSETGMRILHDRVINRLERYVEEKEDVVE